MAPFGTLSPSRDRYFAGVSSSSRAGYDGGPWDESFDIGVAEPPTPGEPLRGRGGSEFCLNRWEKLKISPKLLRPLVEVDVRLDEAKTGEGWLSRESMVDARFRPGASRPWFDELEWVEWADVAELSLASGGGWYERPADERAGD